MADRRMTTGLVVQAGHLAVWLGLYFASAYVAAALVLGRGVSVTAVLACFCAGVGLYLLDRVKIRDAWLDPADRIAQPDRFDFLLARRKWVRVAAWGTLLCGTIAAATIDLRNLALPPIGIGGVVLYSTLRRGGPRMKDVLLVKNLLPGLAIASLAVVFAWQSPPLLAAANAWRAAGVLGGLVLLVTADAVLCDLDDMAADAAHRTRTVPTVLGVKPTWLVALALHAAAGGVLVFVGTSADGLGAAGLIAAGNLIATLGLFVARPAKLRDLVDLKLPVVVALVWALG